jgi:hypothetical protein
MMGCVANGTVTVAGLAAVPATTRVHHRLLPDRKACLTDRQKKILHSL